MSEEKDVVQQYQNKIRIRVSGILLVKDQLLLVNHRGLSDNNIFWSPPGGGMEFGQNSKQTLEREFIEETGLKIRVGSFLFVNEVIINNLHAVELFFEVFKESGEIVPGEDPESSQKDQIIKNVAYLSLEEIHKLPQASIHNSLQNLQNISDIFKMKRYTYFSGIRNK